MHRHPLFTERLVSADEAVSRVRSGDRVLVGSGCAAPQELLRALVRRAPELNDVELVHLLTYGIAPYVEERYEGSFRHNAFFIGANVRQAVRQGAADYTPIFLSEVPNLFYSKQMDLDVAMVMVTPPDRHGHCSLGIHPDVSMAAIDCATHVIAQVNRGMPRVPGDTFVHLSRLDAVVEHDEPLLELPTRPIDEVAMQIARHVASLIDDGSTLQLGIGSIPNAVLTLLTDRHDLGIHSEMISDGVVPLCEAGVITNRQKGLHPGKTVSSFAMGSRDLYDYLDDNASFEFHRTEYVNAPAIIAQNQKVVAINSALQVDLTGQISADSVGSQFYSGIGGQVDFVRGAAMSPGGKPIIALPSTAKSGTVSRLVPTLEAGSGVVTSRGDVHYVVTEHGIAYLHGKTIRERATALIEIADPGAREALRAAAVERRYISGEWVLPDESARYPADMEERRRFGDKALLVRPLRAADTDRLMEFFYSHRPETVYGRYQHPKVSLHRGEAMRLCTLDYSRRFALAVFSEEGRDAHIIAIARYELNERDQLAQTAVVVHEHYRRLGIGTYLMKRLQFQAERCHIAGFYADFGPENRPIVALHRSLGHPVARHVETECFRYVHRFSARPSATDSAPSAANVP